MLLEVLVWISVFILAMGAIVSSIIFFYRANRVAIGQADAIASAQRGIDSMVRTLREAAYASDGAYPVVSLGANDIQFYANVDSDAFVEKVRYFLSGTAIMRTTTHVTGDPPAYTGTQTTDTVAPYVRNASGGVSLFTYYDNVGAAITDYARISDVRSVTMNVLVDVAVNEQPDSLQMRSSAAMRNLVGQYYEVISH